MTGPRTYIITAHDGIKTRFIIEVHTLATMRPHARQGERMSKKQFKAESKQLLDLMINSIYTHREIFLREIVSNASDAIDKLHYLSITKPDEVKVAREDMMIRVSSDKDARTVTVSDNGIGMDKDDLEKNLGVIAHSGSLDFKKEMEEGKDVDIIGQFGVGFYSAFLVADEVTVVTKKYGSDQAYRWRSKGADGYTVDECEKDGWGTDVIMHLRPDDDNERYSDFLETYRLEDLVKKYSDYVRWPIHMDVQSGKYEDTGEKDENGEPKKEWVETVEDKVVNSMVPIWQKAKADVTDEECFRFYKEKFRDWEDPLSVIRIDAEGAVSYKAMLFIPKVAPYNFYSRDFEPGLQLYSSGVMIMEKCKDLLPDCFRFVRGVVDSPDLSLNISREMLQHDRQLAAIRNNIEKKVQKELERMLKDEREKYLEFFKAFGLQLKYGMVEGYGAKADMLKDLVLYHSLKRDEMITLREYRDAMPPDQPRIYYAAAETVARAKQLPQIEQVTEKGYDTLCLAEEADEFSLKTLREYDGKEFCDVAGGDLGLETEDEKKEFDEKKEAEKDVLAFMKETLGDTVSDVRLSNKLRTHAVALSADGDVSLEMEKYFSAIPGQADQVKAKRVLEVNPTHPAYAALKKAFDDGEKEKAADMAVIMYDQAALIAGIPLDDIVGYADRVFKLF